MYLTQLWLNYRCPQVRQDLEKPYEMHRTLSRAFGDSEAAWQAARLLFRVEEPRRDARPRVLVQSRSSPEWQALPAGYVTEPPGVKTYDPAFTLGQACIFRLRANPTCKRIKGKREGLYHPDERLAWLARKGNLHGFRVETVTLTSEGQETLKAGEDGSSLRIQQLQCKTRRGHEAIFSAARFDGILVVTDPELLRHAVEAGIGSAKGFGFGLLSLARA